MGRDENQDLPNNWHDQQTLAPLLPVIRVMGKVKIKVIDAK